MAAMRSCSATPAGPTSAKPALKMQAAPTPAGGAVAHGLDGLLGRRRR